MRLLILFAFPREVRETLRTIGRARRVNAYPFRAFLVHQPTHLITVAETGLGIDNARRVLLHLVQREAPDGVISIGYCGALTADVSVGEVILASRICGIEGGKIENISLSDDTDIYGRLSSHLALRAGTFLTMKEWIRKRDLVPLLTRDMLVPVCDMETYGLALLCRERTIPFIGLRAVSDGADQDIAFDPWSVCDTSGTYRLTRAAKLFLGRPHLLTHARDLHRNARIASRNLAHAINSLLHLL